MAKKQQVEQKDAESEEIDLNLDNMDDGDNFVRQAKQEAQQETEEAAGGSGAEEVALNLDDIDTDDIHGDSEEREAAEAAPPSYGVEEVEENDGEREENEERERTKEQATKDEEDEDEKNGDDEEITVSKKEWEELQQEKKENLERWRRALADYENLQKQSREERERLVTEANQNLMRSLIPLLDNFSMAIDHVPEDLEDNNWVEGVTYINRQMLDLLKEEGLEVLNPEGEDFNPELHEAVETSNGAEDTDQDEESKGEEGTPKVKEVIQPGYTFHGKVLKPAKVVVE